MKRSREADSRAREDGDSRCASCQGELGPDEPTRACPDGHVRGHRDCLEDLEACPLLRCGRALIEAGQTEASEGESEASTPSVTALSTTGRPRCPVCGDDFAPDEPTFACAEDHIAVHVDCHLEGLVRRCPAIGCELELAPRGASPDSFRGRVVVRPETLGQASKESSAAAPGAIFVDSQGGVTGPLTTREQRLERRRRLRSERAARIAEDTERGRALLERVGLERRQRSPRESLFLQLLVILCGALVLVTVGVLAAIFDIEGLPVMAMVIAAAVIFQQGVLAIERRFGVVLLPDGHWSVDRDADPGEP